MGKLKIYKSDDFNLKAQDIDFDAMCVIDKLQKHNFDACVVGGGVRDLILGKKPKDFDIATNANPKQVFHLFRDHALMIGRRFRIVHVIFDKFNPDKFVNIRPICKRHVIEVTTYRSSKINKPSKNRFGKIMEDNIYGSQMEDALRRDFTINALYYDPIKGVIYDYHNAIDDLQSKTLRVIGDPKVRYREDPVRMLRAIRLSVKLGMKIEDKASIAIKEMNELLTQESSSRLFEEMLKILLCGHAGLCIDALKAHGINLTLFPMLNLLFGKRALKSKKDKNDNDLEKRDHSALCNLILKRTDERIEDKQDVSAIFVLATLLWGYIDDRICKLMSKVDSKIDTDSADFKSEITKNAIAEFSQKAYDLGISKNMYDIMSYLWLLQDVFLTNKPDSVNTKYLLSRGRLKQAFHLFDMRVETNEVQCDKSHLKAWQDFMEDINACGNLCVS